MLEINIKIYLKITCLFSSSMWHLPRESFDLATKSLSKIRLKKTEWLQRRKHLYEKLVSNEKLILKMASVCVPSCFSRVWLFVTLWIGASQASLSLGFSRQEYWSGLRCPLAGDLPNPGPEPMSSALQADSLLLSHQGSPNVV